MVMRARGSLQLDDVVDKTGKINIENIIPEINLDVDLDAGRLRDLDYLGGAGAGGALGDVAPWTEPPSPLTPPPIPKRGGFRYGFPIKASRSSLRDRDGSTTTLPISQQDNHSLPKSKSFQNHSSRPSSPPSIPSSSGSAVAKSMLSSLIRKKSKSRVRAQTLENDGRNPEHPSLRPRTPPLPEIPAFPPGNKKRGRKDRPVDLGMAQPKNGEDVIMKLDTDLDDMGGIVDTSMVANGAFSASASTRGGSSIHTHQSMSDDGKHSSHHSHSHSNASSSMMMSNNYTQIQLNHHLGPIPHSEFHNPFQPSSPNSNSPHSDSIPNIHSPHPYSPSSTSTSSPPRAPSLANFVRDPKISPKTIVPLPKQLNVSIPPTSNNGIHRSTHFNGAPTNGSNLESRLEVNPSDDLHEPSSPSGWAPPESWNTQLAGDPANPDEEDESYYSSSEGSLLAHDSVAGSLTVRAGSGSGAGMGPGGRGTVGGGRPIKFARTRSGVDDDDDDDDDDNDYELELSSTMSRSRIGVDEHGRRVGLGTSASSIKTASTNTYIPHSLSSSGYPPSASGSVASLTYSIGRGRKPSVQDKKIKVKHPRKYSGGSTYSSLHYDHNDDYPLINGMTQHHTITGSINENVAPSMSRLNLRRPLLPPAIPPPLPSHQQSQSHDRYKQQNTQEFSPRFTIRIYRANNTYHVVSCGFNVTVQTLTPRLNAKLLHEEEREGHRLYLKERGRERILGHTERPADIVRRRLEQAGYDVADGFELLADDSLSFLLKFVYKSQVFGPTEQNLSIEDYERVDLSGRSLRTIPVALHQHADQIVSLSLSRNPMLDLPLDFIQSCISLTELRLSQMALKKVPTNVRAALSLTRLDISSNRIGDLEDAYLENIPSLRTLHAQNNRMEKLPWHFPRLRALTTLNISNNKFRTLPKVVCQLENLRDLDISFNSISDLPEELGLLRNLEHLIMVGNHISKIPPEAAGLVSLRRLDCRRNLIADLTVISTLPKLEKLSADHNNLHGLDLCLGPLLTTIDASFNEITQIAMAPGPLGRPPSSLISLDVSHAKLSSLDSLALSELVSLRTLNLSYNQFKFLPSSLGNLEYLETLSCSDNVLEALPGSIGRLKRLELLDVHNNNLTELPAELWNCPSLMKLNATSNLIEKWTFPTSLQCQCQAVGGGESGSLEDDDLHMHPFPERKASTVSLTATASSASIRLPSLAYALERLYLGENQLSSETIETILPLFQELKVLNLSFNSIQDLPSTFFKSLASSQKSNLEELYLSGNGMTTLPTEDLVKMTKLGTLYLNGNRLQSLPQELGKVKNLTVLDVGSNSLKYNIYNWEFDWNWNFNKKLKYLNLSGNKRLQIKSDHSKIPGGSRQSRIPAAAASASLIRQQSLGGFTDLVELRVLGLMDVTITTTGESVDIPDENEDRRVRTSESIVCGMAYGIADTLGRNDHLNMVDLVHEFSSAPHHRKNEAIFAIFGRSQPPKASAGISGNRIAKFLRDKFVEVFCAQLAGLKEDRGEGVPDALRRSFLKVNQNLHDMLFSNRKQYSPSGDLVGSHADLNLVIQRGGASGVVLYFRGKTMYAANAGNALAVVSRGGHAVLVSRKHDPYDQLEISRIRAAEGWISPAGLVNDEIDISRSFGFFYLLPIINARPDIITWELSELDEFVIVANRGLWDFVSYTTAVDIARRERGDPMLAAQKLRDFAMSYGADGSTMIMVISVADLFRTDESRSREGSIADSQMYKPVPPRPKVTITDRGLRRLQDEVPAPTGHLALVFTDIRNSTHLWDVNRGMNTAWRLHNTLLRRKLRFCGGYEVKTEGDSFMCAFPTTMAAVWWCLVVQMELLDEDWPLEILECADGKPISDLDNKIIARGLSVRMGIHCGAPLCEVDPVNHRMDYFGPMVNRSARINSSAAGGQIMCSEEVIREIRAKLYDGQPTPQSEFQPAEAVDNVRRLGVTIFKVGEVKLKGLELPEQLSLIYPGHLAARHDLRVSDPDASGSKVDFSVSQIRQLGLICIRLESLATSRIFREIGERKASIQTVNHNDNEEEEDPLYLYGDPNLLLPPLDEKTSSERDISLVLDALSGRIENAVAKIREKAEACSFKDSLMSVLSQREDFDERTLQSILSIIQGL